MADRLTSDLPADPPVTEEVPPKKLISFRNKKSLEYIDDFDILKKMKIKDLNQDIIEQLVELECNNILPVLASVGLNLTPQHMREQLESFKESDVVISKEAGKVDGFAMYEVKGAEITVISFNLKKFNSSRILSTLLFEIFKDLKNATIAIIKSHAHHTNTRSLNFHRRMGFNEVGSTKHHVEFQISKEALLAVIERRMRRLQP